METIRKYDTLSTYISLAKKTIAKFAPKFYKNLTHEMLSNDDAISDVANAIMTADWKYDNERTGKTTGQSKTRYSYRNQCAIWAIKTYVTNKYKKTNKNNISYDPDMHSHINSYETNPLEIMIDEESEVIQKECIEKILSSNLLSDKQKEHINLYYFENMTLADIGKRYGVTREAIRQSLLKGINQIKSYV
jgi:RNA polymerase sigma factor (sigma-70 family)